MKTTTTTRKGETMETTTLNGTPKQVQWANDIRAAMVDDLSKLCEPGGARGKAINDVVHKTMMQQTSAKWWIEARDEHTAKSTRALMRLWGALTGGDDKTLQAAVEAREAQGS